MYVHLVCSGCAVYGPVRSLTHLPYMAEQISPVEEDGNWEDSNVFGNFIPSIDSIVNF